MLAVMAVTLAATLATTTVAAPIPVYADYSSDNQTDNNQPTPAPEEEDTTGLNLQEIHNDDYVDGGTNVSVNYSGVKVTVSGSDWGNDWGNDSHWQIQLKQVTDTSTDEVYDVSFKIKSEVDREVYIKLGAPGKEREGMLFGDQTVSLKAGELTKVAMTTDKVVDVNDMMVLFALGTKWGSTDNTITISNLKVTPHRDVAVKDGAINLGNAVTEFYVGSDWAGVSAEYKETGTKTEFDVKSYGWNKEWGMQYILKNLGLKKGETYTVSADVTSTIDKKIIVKLDDSGALVDTISVVAGETTEYVSKPTLIENDLKNDFLYFAIAQVEGEAKNRSGKLTIENVRIQDSQGNYTVLSGGTAAGAKGLEYDFAADNSAYDYADPGKVKDGYQLIFADEFDGNYAGAHVDESTGLNLDNWAYQLGDGTTDCGNTGWGNKELQAYTADKKNIAVNEDLTGDNKADGLLRITASYDKSGYKYANETEKKYTSARIRTTDKNNALFNGTYGYYEARISLPQTKGAWPAFWMLPQSTDIYGGWPVSGEIDILETTGTQTNKACSTLHWGVPAHVYKGSGYVDLNSDIRYFHTYAVDWKPGQMDFLYDGKVIYTSTDWESSFAGTSDSLSFDAPFDMPFYMILNLAVDSGQFGGSANAAEFKDDINMYVDYVRVYQKTAGYADSVEKTASNNVADDWQKYADVAQIADINMDNLVAAGGSHADEDVKNSGKWYLSTQSDAKATASMAEIDGRPWAKVNVETAGSNDYSVQLIGHYDAKAHYVYKISFDTYAEGAIAKKKANVDSKEYKGWSTYGIKRFALKNEPTHYEYMFEQSDDFDNCRIEFNLGAIGTGTVYLSNVKVEIVDPTLIGKIAADGTHSPLANGNMIYNGSFDQGNNHIGYWSATKGTKLEVPRYTTTALTESDVKVVDIASKTNYENIADGVKYYERRAQISAKEGSPQIYQSGLRMTADTYAVSFDMYSAKDSAVRASIVAFENGTLGRELASAKATYEGANGVKNYVLTFTTKEDVTNAALVLTFADGTQVQIDNVSMTGTNQKSTVNDNPVNSKNEWTGDNGGGQKLTVVTNADGSYTISNLTSGGTWYSPQFGCEDFEVIPGVKYKLSYKFKLEGDNNGTFDYIVQENGGQWTVVLDVTKVNTEGLEKDQDGYYIYETEFNCNADLDDCHINFGFGNSAAKGDTSFTLKDINLSIMKATSDMDKADNNDSVEEDNFNVVETEDEVAPQPPVVNPGNGGSSSYEPAESAPVAVIPSVNVPVRPRTPVRITAPVVPEAAETTPVEDATPVEDEASELTVESNDVTVENEQTPLAVENEAKKTNAIPLVVGVVAICTVLIGVLEFLKRRKSA